MNKKGFTLIELLAVIIILGILMIIAIPSVTTYISNSRKSAYIDTAKNIISSARNLVNSGKYEMFNRDVTYYIPVSCLPSENGTRTPYGEFSIAYVVVTYDGEGYNYYLSGQGDWGYNAILNGGNNENKSWRTLTADEWTYLLYTRNNTSYVLAVVNGINGFILLPDNWDTSIYELNEYNGILPIFNSNIISENDWITIFEANGAVFLPAAGRRSGYSVSNVGYVCYYWSALYRNPYGNKGPVALTISNNYIITIGIASAYNGLSVRLVKDYNP